MSVPGELAPETSSCGRQSLTKEYSSYGKYSNIIFFLSKNHKYKKLFAPEIRGLLSIFVNSGFLQHLENQFKHGRGWLEFLVLIANFEKY